MIADFDQQINTQAPHVISVVSSEQEVGLNDGIGVTLHKNKRHCLYNVE